MEPVQTAKHPEKSYAGARYYREFISRMRRDEDAGKYEHLEDYPYDMLVDDDLGVRLYHAGINPYDQEHFRHQIYLVVMPHGKASRICPADTVVASALTLQWTRRGDLCNALLLSVKSFGQCAFAYSGERSRNKCGWCGHSMRTLLWRSNAWKWVPYRPGRKLAGDEKHCCSLNQTLKKYQCCRCKDPDNALMSPLDREAAAELPQSVLPATPEAYKMYNNQSAAVVSAMPVTSQQTTAAAAAAAAAAVAGAGAGADKANVPTVNNINLHFYGNNHIYPGSPTSPAGWNFTNMSPLEMESRTRHLLDFVGAMSSTSPTTDPLGGAARVEEIDDNLGRTSPPPIGKPRKYARPRVDDDIADPTDASGTAHPMSRLALNK